MKHWRLLALAFCGLLAIPLIGQAQVPVVGPQTYTFTAGSQSNVWTCNGGQSSFALTVPSGLTGTLTVTTGQTMGSATSNPPWSYAPGAAAYTNTIVNSGSLTVNLGSNLYVKVADTSYSSGSVTVTGVCSGAVAVIPPQGGTPAPTPSPVASGALTITGSYPYTFYAPPTPTPGPSLPISLANGGTATSAPSPSATATSCGAAVAQSGSFPSQEVEVPVCATPAAGSNIAISGSTIALASPSPTACPSAILGTNSSFALQYATGFSCTPVTSVTASGNLSSSGGTTPAITETNSPTWSGTGSIAQLIANAAQATPSPAPTGYYGPAVIAQATAAPTAQPGYIDVTGALTTSGSGKFGTTLTVDGMEISVGGTGTNFMPASSTQPFKFANAANTQNNVTITDAGQVQIPLTTTPLVLGTAGSATTEGIKIFTASGFTDIGWSGAAAVAGITGSAFGIDFSATTNILALSATGSLGVAGQISAQSNGSNPGYVPPVYTPAGAAVASTLHMVIGSCGATTVLPCTVSLSGAAVFAATSTTFCGAADTTGVNTHTYSAYATATNQITAVDSSASSALVTFVCVGP